MFYQLLSKLKACAVRSDLAKRRVKAAWLIILLPACTDPRLEYHSALPELSSLDTLSVIALDTAFSISDAVGTAGCEIIIAGAAEGSLVRVTAGGIAEPVKGGPFGAQRWIHLERPSSGDTSTLLVWARNPPLLGSLSTEDWTFDSLPVPKHDWVGQRGGPLAALGHGRLAFSPVNGGSVRPTSESWPGADAVQVIDPSGRVLSSISPVLDRGGKYLTWYQARVAIGAVGDTLHVLSLSDGVMSRYVLAADGSAEPLAGWRLPRYFTPPVAREGIFIGPILPEDDNEVPWFIGVRHAYRATFGPSGTLYVIRNYEARWRQRRNRFGQTQEWWDITKRALEIFDSRGNLLGAYALPHPQTRWVRSDGNGRLMVRGEDPNSLVLLHDPAVASPSCPPLPRNIRPATADRAPPSATQIGRSTS